MTLLAAPPRPRPPASTAPPPERIEALILAELPFLGPEALDLPLDDAGVDSFDLISLRASLEARLSLTLSDQDWARIDRLSDIARIPALAGPALPPAAPPVFAPPVVRPAPDPASDPAPRPEKAVGAAAAEPMADPPPAPPAPGRLSRRHAIGMPQMALSGLGEAWLFRELGDLHWAMISDVLGAPSGSLRDAQGVRLYATFTRIRLEAAPSLAAFRENDVLTLSARLRRSGASLFFAEHEGETSSGGEAGPARLRATTMSTFSRRGVSGENRGLLKGAPVIPSPDPLPSEAELPAFAQDYRAERAREAPAHIFACDYQIQPPHDVNGVGLLYFAAYPTIFDLCLERFEGRGFLLAHSTVAKDVFYFANADPSETLLFRLERRAWIGGEIRHEGALLRLGDGCVMGRVFSRKRPI